jgi:hypothetical protein
MIHHPLQPTHPPLPSNRHIAQGFATAIHRLHWQVPSTPSTHRSRRAVSSTRWLRFSVVSLTSAEKFGKFGQALQGRLQFLRCRTRSLLGKAFRFILRPLQVAGEFLGIFVQLSALVVSTFCQPYSQLHLALQFARWQLHPHGVECTRLLAQLLAPLALLFCRTNSFRAALSCPNLYRASSHWASSSA